MPHESEGWRVFTCYWTGSCSLINFHWSEIDHSEISIMSPVLKTFNSATYAYQAPNKKAPRHKKQFLVIFPALSCYVKHVWSPGNLRPHSPGVWKGGSESLYPQEATMTACPGMCHHRLGQHWNMAGVKSSPLKREVYQIWNRRIGKDYHLAQFYNNPNKY